MYYGGGKIFWAVVFGHDVFDPQNNFFFVMAKFSQSSAFALSDCPVHVENKAFLCTHSLLSP